MRTSYWLPALLLGLGALVAAPAADAPKADAERIAQLVKQLGSDNFEEREKATKELEAIGTPAINALRRAAKDGEAEVKTRADALIQKAGKKASTEKLLAATKVKLVFKDTPLADAVAEFNKKSGYTIQLHDPDKKLKDRTITLETGEVTFWQAFDKFCEKAGLVEASVQDLMPKGFPGGPGGLVPPGGLPVPPPLPAPPPARVKPAPPPPPPEKKDAPVPEKKDNPKPAAAAPVAGRTVVAQIQIGGGAAPPPAGGGFGGFGGATIMPFGGFGATPGVITVVDGKPKTVPTCYSGAVRIRALKEAPNLGFALPFPGPGAAPTDDGYVVWLEVRAEPKLQILSLQSAALEKATDDLDQQLTQAPPVAPAFPPGFAPPGGAVPPVARPGIRLGGMPAFAMGGLGGAQSFPVYLKKGEKEAKALKEFAGSLSAMVLTPAEAVITADKITKAAGETFKGKESGQIKVNEVKEEDGKLTLKFEVEQPRDVLPANTTGPVGPVGVPPRIRRGIPVPPPAPAAPAPPGGGTGVAFQAPAPPAPPIATTPIQIQIGGGPAPGITLVDDKGKTIPQTGGAPPRFQFTPGGTPKIEYTQEYKLDKDQKPAKLILSGSKMATLDIPFSFKDVPLK